MKALVVRLSSIGDVVHTLPALAALHEGGWEVDWLVEPAACDLLSGHPLLARVVSAPAARAFRPGPALAAARDLRSRRYDLAIDFQGLWKSAAWARFSGAGRTLGLAPVWRREPSSARFLGETLDLPTGFTSDHPHVIDLNLALLRPLGIEAVGSRAFPLPPCANQSRAVADALAARGLSRFAILNPGGGWANKRWPPEGFGAVARGLRERGIRSLVTFGPGETPLADRVVAASAGAAERAFSTTLLEYIELARRALVVAAADTGPLHLACAVGTPVVGLFGPTDPARNGPFAADDVVVRRTPPCAPCHRRDCPTHATVMSEITPDEVLRAIETRLGRARGGRTVAV